MLIFNKWMSIGMLSMISSAAALAQSPVAAATASYPTPKESVWVAKDFKFHTGVVFPELKISYTTVGEPNGIPVLFLHGTSGSGSSLIKPGFANELFGPGQVLDATKYFVILPDAIGTGKSTKPSDGMKASFPLYNYDDMVTAQYRLVTEGLGLKHLRLVMGNSMGGMQTWLWGIKYPDFMDAIAPMASMPIEMSGRNWLMRRMITDSIRQDPLWNNGNYTTQPPSAKFAITYFQMATSGGTQGLYALAPTREKADQLIAARMNAPFTGDANDLLYQWDSSRDYNPSADLEKILVPVLVINSADDERNPSELGLDAALKRIKNVRLHLIPASSQTSGHGTTAQAKWWKKELAEFLNTSTKP
jgi:homoserine O-acetyltransferase